MSDPQQPQGAPASAPKPASSRTPLILGLAIGAVLVLGLGWYLLRGRSGQSPATSEQPVHKTLPGGRPQVSVTPIRRAPALGESDPRVRELVALLSPEPELKTWLASEDLARRFVSAVNNIAEGTSPRASLAFMAPQGAFQVVERKGHTFIAPASFARYDVVARVFSSLDVQASALTYNALKPIFDEAYKEISRPGQQLDQTLANAIQRMLDTPVPEGDIEVVDTPGVNYVYAAPELEQLSAAQKHLLRMGPANARAIQTKLRELQAALALPTASR